MTYEVYVTPLAWQEIENSYEWLAQLSRAAAVRWKEKTEAAIMGLALDPHRHPEAPEAFKAGFDLRQMLVGRRHATFRVLFEIADTAVRFLRVRHNKQELLEADELQYS